MFCSFVEGAAYSKLQRQAAQCWHASCFMGLISRWSFPEIIRIFHQAALHRGLSCRSGVLTGSTS